MRGGAERIAKRIAEGLKERGHEVLVITARPRDFVTGLEEHNGVKIYNFYPLNIFYYTNDFKKKMPTRLIWHFIDMFNFDSARLTKKILIKEKPDVVITHNLKGIGYLIPRVIRKLGLKHIHTLHDVQLAVPKGLIIKGKEDIWEQRTVLRLLYEKLCCWLFNSPDVIVSPSQWLLDFYIEKKFFRISQRVVLSNPIFKKTQPIEKESSNKFRFTFIGQVEEHKGILFLLEVFKELNWPDIELNIVGGGSILREVKSMAKGDKRINFLGIAKQEDLKEIFQITDVAIVPSLCYENSPGVIYDSFLFGVPVIVSNIGGIPELVREFENGLIFEAGDKKELKDKIKYCLEHKQKIKEMGQKGQEHVKDFSLDNYLQKLEKLI